MPNGPLRITNNFYDEEAVDSKLQVVDSDMKVCMISPTISSI